jgi:hypothetical protein
MNKLVFECPKCLKKSNTISGHYWVIVYCTYCRSLLLVNRHAVSWVLDAETILSGNESMLKQYLKEFNVSEYNLQPLVNDLIEAARGLPKTTLDLTVLDDPERFKAIFQ